MSGHDFWIEPSAFQTSVGARLALRLRVGEHFRGDPVARDPARVARFVRLTPGGEQVAVQGVPGADPAGVAVIEHGGLHLIGYRSSQSFIELPAALFESYLREEGLESVAAWRAEHGESQSPGRELYSRCAKSLIEAGKGEHGFDRLFGFPLELVPENNPYALAAAGELPVRLLFRNQPLAGALLVAYSQQDPSQAMRKRTDAQGRAVFPLRAAGPWLIKAVHMERTTGETRADWESWWAALTFAVPDR